MYRLLNLTLSLTQWANTGGKDQVFDANIEAWFKKIKDVTGKHVKPVVDYKKPRPMSELTYDWTFSLKREFDLPYKKRTWATKSTQLSTSGWVRLVDAPGPQWAGLKAEAISWAFSHSLTLPHSGSRSTRLTRWSSSIGTASALSCRSSTTVATNRGTRLTTPRTRRPTAGAATRPWCRCVL